MDAISNDIELYCWILGSNSESSGYYGTLVTIEKTKMVANLRDKIKESNQHTLKPFDARTLALWKASKAKENIDLHLQQMNRDSLRDRDKLPSLRSLSEVFPDAPEGGHVYVIIVVPGGEYRLPIMWTVLH